jgi:hypothetical protein
MVPGTSRSGATIIGGMLLGLSRKAATDFSFYLAIPTLIGAGVYSLYKERALLSLADVPAVHGGLGVFIHQRLGLCALVAAATSLPTALWCLPGTASPLAWWSWPPPYSGLVIWQALVFQPPSGPNMFRMAASTAAAVANGIFHGHQVGAVYDGDAPLGDALGELDACQFHFSRMPSGHQTDGAFQRMAFDQAFQMVGHGVVDQGFNLA